MTETARKYNIGTLPKDSRNVAPSAGSEPRYFFVPNVPKIAVKDLVNGIMNAREERSERQLQKEIDTPVSSKMISSNQTISPPVSSVEQYIAPVKDLQQMIVNLVEAEIRICKSHSKTQNSFDTEKLNQQLVQNIHFRNISKLLKDFHGCNGTILSKEGNFLSYCSVYADGLKCIGTVFHKTNRWTLLCIECRKVKKNDEKKESRKRKSGGEWVDADSKVNISLLSPNSRKKRLRRTRDRKYYLKCKLNDTLLRQDQLELNTKNKVDEELMKYIQGACSVGSDLIYKFRSMMIESISSAIPKDLVKDENDEDQYRDIKEFVDDILNKIRNFCLLQEGKTRSVRYTAREIRLALSLYNMNPSGYKELKESSLYINPSVRSLNNWRSASAVQEGIDPSIYGRLRERMNISGMETEYVQLLVDEMKLQSGVYTNVMTNQIVGLVPVGSSWNEIRKEVRAMANELAEEMSLMEGKTSTEDTEDKTTMTKKPTCSSNETLCFTPALYVNQWRIRTAFNKSANVEFFFNDGSLNGNELLFQLFHVCNQLNNVNIIVLLLMFDAGGSNSRLASLLRHSVELPLALDWLDDSMISFTDPTGCQQTKTAIAHCSTHGLKALRNAFLASSKDEKTSRHFRSKDGIQFTWEGCVAECFYRDRQDLFQHTMLTKDSVFPNQWNKMRVGEALRVFSDKTLTEQFTSLGMTLSCFQDLLYSGDVNECKDVPTMHKKRLGIIRNALFSKKNEASNNIKEIFAGLEFSVYVACIFNERFMNKARSITRENIENLEEEMKSNLLFFKEWMTSSLEMKQADVYKDKGDKWTECCIDKKTYNNLRIQICGFFYFARSILQANDLVEYVPFLFSNQSSLESFFSQIRARNADTPQKYCAAIGTMETTKTMTALNAHQNRMYNGTVHADEVQVAVSGFDQAIASTFHLRSSLVETWMNEGKGIREAIHDSPIPILHENTLLQYLEHYHGRKNDAYFNKHNDSFQRIVQMLKAKTLDSSFLNLLVKDTSIVSSAVASINSGSTTQQWFHALFTISSAETMNKFNIACQKVVSKCLHLFRDSIMFSEQSKFSSIWYLLYYSIDKEKLLAAGGPFSDLPLELRSNQCGLYMIFELILKYVERVIIHESRNMADKMSDEKSDERSDERFDADSQNMMITSFVGFAVYSLIQHYGELEQKARVRDDKATEKECYEIGTYLRRMRILHADAILNVSYLQKNYSRHDQMLNHGGRTLISPEFMHFAITLTSLCNKELSTLKISERGTLYLSKATEHIMNNQDLLQAFNKFNEHIKFKDSVVLKKHQKRIYKALLQKTARARSSYELGRYREQNIGQYAKDSSTDPHRVALKLKYGNESAKAAGMKADKELLNRKSEIN
jgi:hypothetical protein